MSIIDDWKGKAASYLEDVEKKKDELIEKAATIRREYDESQRRKTEDWIYKKEAELKELEKTLKKREEIIRQNELKLKKKFFARFIGVTAGLSVIGFFALAAFTATTETGKHSLTTQAVNTETILPPPKSSEPYSPKESAVYIPLSVPSDSKAQFFVLEKGGTGAQRTIVTKRVGSSGTSYSKRLYNCTDSTVKYLGTGDSLDAMAASSADPNMGPIVQGSIAYYVGVEACK